MLRRTLCYILLIPLATSCRQETPVPAAPAPKQVTEAGGPYLVNSRGDTIPTGVPIRVQGKRIDPDSIAPPKVTILRNLPEATTTPSGIHPMVDTLRLPTAENLKVMIPGQDSVPMLKTVPAKGTLLPMRQPKPVAALPLRRKDSAHEDFQYLDVEQGLPSPIISVIMKGSRGALWMAGPEGYLSHYDGSIFMNYKVPEKEGLCNSILEDHQGDLWFGYVDGGLYRYNGSELLHYTSEGGLVSDGVLDLLQDRRGYIWISTREGISVYDPKHDHFTQITADDALMDNRVFTMTEDSRGRIWLGTLNRLTVYQPERPQADSLSLEGSFTHFGGEKGFPGWGIHAILEDSLGKLWMASRTGLYRYDPNVNEGRDSFTRFSFSTIFGTKPYPIAHEPLSSLAEDERRNLWIGTYEYGLIRFNPYDLAGSGSFTQYTTQDGLSSNSITAIIKDGRGGI